MKTKLTYLITFLFAIMFIACTKDFVVQDIKKKEVSIIAPADNVSTPSNLVTFWWDELDGAENYNLQIVKPSFSSVQQLIVDTTLVGTKFSRTLTPGTYQWRIKATNSGGSTAYFTRTLTIDTTSNLGYLNVGLVAPLTKTVMANNSIAFSWNSIPAATYYDLIITPSNVTPITISNITNTSYTYSFSVATGSEVTYKWNVIAHNSFSQSKNNLYNTFKIDFKNPLVASLNPSNGGTYKDTNNLVWARNTSSPDIKYDIVTLGEDSSFVTSHTWTVQTLPYSVKINSAVTYTGSILKPLWWQVVSVDSVGNQSLPSISKRFYIH